MSLKTRGRHTNSHTACFTLRPIHTIRFGIRFVLLPVGCLGAGDVTIVQCEHFYWISVQPICCDKKNRSHNRPEWTSLLYWYIWTMANLFFKIFGGHKSFLWGHWYPCFGLLMTSSLGFKARVDPSLEYFVTCMPWIPEIHLWCDTCWLYRGPHGSQLYSPHASSRGRLLGFDRETSRIVSGHAVHSATATG